VNTTDNIKKYLKYKGIPLYKFLNSINKSNGYLNSTKNFSLETIEDIIKLYPDLSLDWLITGKGEMLIKNTVVSESIVPYSKINSADEVIQLREELKEAYIEIGRLQGENRLLREQVGLGERKVNGKSA